MPGQGDEKIGITADGVQAAGTGEGLLAGTVYMSLHDADPTDDAATAAGNEQSGGNYSRLAVAFAQWSRAAKVFSNRVALTFALPSAAWDDPTHVGMWDSETGGKLLHHEALTNDVAAPRTGSAVTYAAGALTVTLGGEITPDGVQAACQSGLLSSTVYASLHTADPTDVAATAAANELTGNAYARLAVASAQWTRSAKEFSNNVSLVYAVPTGDWGDPTHLALWDSETGGKILSRTPLTNDVAAPRLGSAVTLPIGALDFGLA